MLLLLSGPTGVGKTTLLRLLTTYQGLEERFVAIPTYTTRLPRVHEKHGRDYFFINEQDFLRNEQATFFAEVATVGGFKYGTARNALHSLSKGQIGCMVVNREGVRLWRSLEKSSLAVWLYVSDMQLIGERLSMRHRGDAKYAQARFKLACEEQEAEDMRPVCAFRVQNDASESAFREILGLVRTYEGKTPFL